ncbi:hypothetical protein [Lentibacillus sp. Marseille-P4043]|uniref:hypothetical protein n=1 Tax=Lentibacillus sp. Marseille-P4043 TaxID=2040293 RepID=UPI00131A4C6A
MTLRVLHQLNWFSSNHFIASLVVSVTATIVIDAFAYAVKCYMIYFARQVTGAVALMTIDIFIVHKMAPLKHVTVRIKLQC